MDRTELLHKLRCDWEKLAEKVAEKFAQHLNPPQAQRIQRGNEPHCWRLTNYGPTADAIEALSARSAAAVGLAGEMPAWLDWVTNGKPLADPLRYYEEDDAGQRTRCIAECLPNVAHASVVELDKLLASLPAETAADKAGKAEPLPVKVLEEVTTDGPFGMGLFRWNGTPHPGLTPKAFLLVEALWKSTDRTLTTAAAEDAVYGVNPENDIPYMGLDGLRTVANRFFRKRTIPLVVSMDQKLGLISLAAPKPKSKRTKKSA